MFYFQMQMGRYSQCWASLFILTFLNPNELEESEWRHVNQPW